MMFLSPNVDVFVCSSRKAGFFVSARLLSTKLIQINLSMLVDVDSFKCGGLFVSMKHLALMPICRGTNNMDTHSAKGRHM